MQRRPFPNTIALASMLAAGLTALAAHAGEQSAGQHPAVLQQRQAPAIDPNTFIVAHPAGLALRTGHANHEHPAVATARRLATGGAQPLDANLFLVQPPASTTWTDGSEAAPRATAVATAAR